MEVILFPTSPKEYVSPLQVVLVVPKLCWYTHLNVKVLHRLKVTQDLGWILPPKAGCRVYASHLGSSAGFTHPTWDLGWNLTPTQDSWWDLHIPPNRKLGNYIGPESIFCHTLLYLIHVKTMNQWSIDSHKKLISELSFFIDFCWLIFKDCCMIFSDLT